MGRTAKLRRVLRYDINSPPIIYLTGNDARNNIKNSKPCSTNEHLANIPSRHGVFHHVLANDRVRKKRSPRRYRSRRRRRHVSSLFRRHPLAATRTHDVMQPSFLRPLLRSDLRDESRTPYMPDMSRVRALLGRVLRATRA